MRNPNIFVCSAWRFLTMASFLFIIFSVDGLFVDSDRNRSLEWQILTKKNFSSQIRLHQHILLMVTVPWSGESHSLMKELVHVAASKQESLGLIKFMVIYKNTEKMLADVLGATNEITIFCFQQSISYKYQGRLRSQNILSSFDYLMSLRHEDLPLKTLNTAEDLKAFYESTDKAVLLLDFCGWGARLLGIGNNDGENALHVKDVSDNGSIFEANFNGVTNSTRPSKGKINQKGLRNEKLTCGVENGLSGIPLLGEFSLANDSDPSVDFENARPGVGVSCTLNEFRQFDHFFQKFTTVAREFFLPLERQRFGLVSERALLSSLGVGDSNSWLVMFHFLGCPNCSKILKEVDDLRSILQMHHSPVIELEGEGHDLEPALPANKPSIILFVDRSSESLNIRKKSIEALNTFRELALYSQFSHQMVGQNSVNHGELAVQASPGTRSRIISDLSGNRRMEFSPATQMAKIKDKMAVMIINEGGNVALNNIAADEQLKSIHDILANLLQQKKEAKLSSLAKEVGFQLLSEDIEVKLADLLSSQTKTSQSAQVSSELSKEEIVESRLNMDQDNLPNTARGTVVEHNDHVGITYVKPSSLYHKEKSTSVEENSQFIPVEPDQIIMNGELSFAGDMGTKEKSSMQIDKLGERKVQHQHFKVCFFFSDGGYQMLRDLTGGSKIPSIVILDPMSQQHYNFPEEAVFSYSSLVEFLDGFLNGSLLSHQRSESILTSPREPMRPPFVNLDFHEVDPIPRVTSNTFTELVLGFNHLDTQNVGNAWMKDVLVLFSNSWCGFCQRMELVVHEVYRVFKGYMNMLKSESRKGKSLFITDNFKDGMLNELPQIFLMDCTLNDCSSILKSMGQRELYPVLMLFPAGRKNAVLYQGDMAVSTVIKFIVHHGSNSQHLRKGILLNGAEEKERKQNPLKHASPTLSHEKAPVSRGNYHEVLLNNKIPAKAVKDNRIGSHTSEDLNESAPNVIVGSVLTATEMLLNAPPFDKSTILIVKADHSTGFQGLIINKHINWDTLHELEGLELLKKAPLSFGGPLIVQSMPLVSLVRRFTKGGYPEVLPNVFFLDQLATSQAIEDLKSGNQTVKDYWFFLGYSGWGWDQLFLEMAEGAWHINDDHVGQLDWP